MFSSCCILGEQGEANPEKAKENREMCGAMGCDGYLPLQEWSKVPFPWETHTVQLRIVAKID